MQDLMYAFRILSKRWVFTGVAVVVMALGISLTATMFAIVDGVAWSGPEYGDLDEIVYIATTVPQATFDQPVRIHDYLDWREQQHVFSEMAAWRGVGITVSGDGARAERFSGSRISASTFDLLGVQPLIGRSFTPEQDLTVDQDVLLLGYDVWQNRYGGDRDIVGSTLRINARPVAVIGVMPEGFDFPEAREMWMPLAVDPNTERGAGTQLSVIGRMAEGVALQEVRANLGQIATGLQRQYPEANRDINPVVNSWREEQFVDPETTGLLYTMLAAVVGVLLIACANVANMLFALTMARGKELAIRTAMGAARRRVLKQLLSESLVLAGLGAIIGLFLSYYSLKLFRNVVVPLDPPQWMKFELSPIVFLFVVGITLLAALASGLVPALYATKSDVSGVLRDQSRGSSSRSVNRWSAGLVGMEVAVSCALLIAAGLMVRTTVAIGSDDFGLSREGILTASVNLPSETYPDSADRVRAAEIFQRELGALPGATDVALTTALPILGTSFRWYGVSDREYLNDSEYLFAGHTAVSPEFFGIIDVELVTGRNFDASDAMGAPLVMVVDERFVETNWPGENVLGKQLRLGRSESVDPWITVVGVVRSFGMANAVDFGGTPPGNMFIPHTQAAPSGFTVMLKSAGDPLALAQPFRNVVDRVDPDIPVPSLSLFEERVKQATADVVIIGGMFSIFGIVALIMASVGLYAVMAFSVSRRKTEVGVRMALGAESRNIVTLILRQGSKSLVIGLVVGLGLAFLLGKALTNFLYGVSASDPLTFMGIPILLAMVSVVALLIPAARASRIDPVAALRD